ncbi:IPT/TIG domain-containing protein [Algibacter sp. PT7-4]|uniref:IPT/TIG domain-containing protein n=1 Tax=Algibacter ulvanivorans TaxID=3400999 RepID=UPI003AAC1189
MKKYLSLLTVIILIYSCSSEEADKELTQSLFPTNISIDIQSASIGDIITINGNGFSTSENYIVTFTENQNATVSEVNNNYLKVEVPENAISGNVSLTFNNQTETITNIEINTPIDINPPSTPNDITYNISFPNVNIDWNASTDIENSPITYEVYLTEWTPNTGTNHYLLDVYPNYSINGLETNENSYSFTNLNPLTKYRIGIKAIDDSGNTSEIEEIDFVMLPSGTYDGDLILTTQVYIDLLENHNINTINGNLIIGNLDSTLLSLNPEKIKNLTNLLGINTIKGSLIIGNIKDIAWNINLNYLENLNGLQDIETISGNLKIEDTNIQNLNELSSLITIGGHIEIYQNPQLYDFCSLTDLIILNNDFAIYENLYNPNLNNFINNECSN